MILVHRISLSEEFNWTREEGTTQLGNRARRNTTSQSGALEWKTGKEPVTKEKMSFPRHMTDRQLASYKSRRQLAILLARAVERGRFINDLGHARSYSSQWFVFVCSFGHYLFSNKLTN